MKLSIHEGHSKLQAKVEHNGEQLFFNINSLSRRYFNQGQDVYDILNQYWNSLTVNQQNDIFELYKEISMAFLNISQRETLTQYITEKVAILMSYHELDKLYNWMYLKANIYIPSDLQDEYVENIDIDTSRAKTYIKRDYVQLLVLTLALKAMTPVWGHYINYIMRSCGSYFKEMRAFDLLMKSPIYRSEPMIKLSEYIQGIIGPLDKGNETSTLKHGLSSEDTVYRLLSLVAIRRLCVADISGVGSKLSLVKSVYEIIMQRLNPPASSLEDTFRPKLNSEGSADEEDKTSSLDRYKVKHDISVGELAEIEHSIGNAADLSLTIRPEIDVGFLDRNIESYHKLLNFRWSTPQTTIMSWIYSSVVPARGLRMSNVHTNAMLLKGAETILWDMGFKHLALLVTAQPIDSDTDTFSIQKPKKKIEPELLDELNTMFPFQQIDYVASNSNNIVTTNPGVKAIDAVVDELSKCSWVATADKFMTDEVLGPDRRKISIPADIKSDLARLIIATVSH